MKCFKDDDKGYLQWVNANPSLKKGSLELIKENTRRKDKMRGKLWLDAFIKALKENEEKLDDSTDTKWTESIVLVMKEVGVKLHCGVSCKKSNKEESEEYLGIDFMFFYKKDYDESESVLPVAIVEHENSYKKENIKYSLWKILCIRSPVKVLICYQSNTENVVMLRQCLEGVIWQGNLMRGSDSDLMVIIGDESVTKKRRMELGRLF